MLNIKKEMIENTIIKILLLYVTNYYVKSKINETLNVLNKNTFDLRFI